MAEISRVTRSKAEARSAYDRLSRWYDLLATWGEAKLRDRGLKMLAAHEGERILEIGFGTGHALVALANQVGPTGQVSGIDLSPGMVGVAQARLRASDVRDRVVLRQGDAAHLPFEDGAFDGIFMSFTLELFDTPEIPRVLAECLRVLRGGGRICLVSMSKLGSHGLGSRLYDWAHQNFPTLADCRPIYGQRALEDAGFSVAQARLEEMWDLPVELVLAKKG